MENISSHSHRRYLLGVPLNIYDEHPRRFYMGGPPPGLNVLLRLRNECHTTRRSLKSCCNVGVIFVKNCSSCHACCTGNVQPRTKLLRHFNTISISRHGTIVSKRHKFAPLPTPPAMLFRLSSSSVHFLCYHKQRCNRGGGKQSFNLRQ